MSHCFLFLFRRRTIWVEPKIESDEAEPEARRTRRSRVQLERRCIEWLKFLMEYLTLVGVAFVSTLVQEGGRRWRQRGHSAFCCCCGHDFYRPVLSTRASKKLLLRYSVLGCLRVSSHAKRRLISINIPPEACCCRHLACFRYGHGIIALLRLLRSSICCVLCPFFCR